MPVCGASTDGCVPERNAGTASTDSGANPVAAALVGGAAAGPSAADVACKPPGACQLPILMLLGPCQVKNGMCSATDHTET